MTCRDCGIPTRNGRAVCDDCWGHAADAKEGRTDVDCAFCGDAFTPVPGGCAHHCTACYDCCDAVEDFDADDAGDERYHVEREESGR